jgi:hypothetical protein
MTDPDGVEELAQPGRRRSRRALRRDLALGAILLFAVVLVTRHGGGGGAGPTPTPTPTGSTTHSGSTTAAPVVAPSDPAVTGSLAVYPVPDRHAGDAARCPAGFACQVWHGMTVPAQDALQGAFPGARVVRARTERIYVANYGQALWTADVQARAGDEVLRLRLQPRSPDDGEQHGTTLFNGHAITHWESVLDQLRVVIDVIAPADRPASLSAIGRLARDTRLLTSW